MRIKYSNGAACKVLGITQESIRYYEKHKIIEPIKLSKNGYRSFSYSDLNRLINLRKYRSMGLTLCKISQLNKSKLSDDLIISLEQQQEELKHQIVWNELVIKYTKKTIASINEIDEMLYKIRLENNPSVYRVSYPSNNTTERDIKLDKFISLWIKKMPVVSQCSILPKNKISIDVLAEIDFSIFEEDSYIVDLNSKYVKYIPSGPSIYTIIDITSIHDGFFKPFAHVFEYMKANHLELSDDVFGINIVSKSMVSNRAIADYYQVWFPYKHSD